MASTTPTRIRRKPAPKPDAELLAFSGPPSVDCAPVNSRRASFLLYPDPALAETRTEPMDLSRDLFSATVLDNDVFCLLNSKRTSFALYPDPLPSPPSPSPNTSFGSASQPHYTRRRANTCIDSPSPSSAPPLPSRRGFTRLRLPHAAAPKPSSPIGSTISKRTISSPKLIPPALSKFLPDSSGIDLGSFGLGVGVPPLALQISSNSNSPISTASSRSSSSSSGRVSDETALTSPSISPLCSATSPMESTRNGNGSSRIVERRSSVSAVACTKPILVSRKGSVPPTPDCHSSSLSRNNPGREFPLDPKTVKTKPAPFPALAPVSRAALNHAARLPLVAPDGERVPFGVLLGMSQGVDDVDTETCVARRTLVVFLRHFWCANCQDYMVALAQGVHEADVTHCPSCDGSAKARDHENASTISSPLASTTITTSNYRANITSSSVPNSSVSEIPILPNISVASPPTLNSNAPSTHLSFSESSLFPYFPSLPCPELTLKPDTPAESAPSRASNDTDANTEEDECVSNDSVTFGYLQDLDFVRKSWGVGLQSGLGSGSDVGGAEVKVTSLKQQAARLSDEEFPDDHQTSECAGGSKTHLLIVAPGSHTLAARYLASFGFPTVDSCVGGEDGSTWDLEDPSSTPRSSSAPKNMVKESEKTVCGHKGIASIRIFVDPCPAEGVYTTLGMGYAPRGTTSQSASPRSAVAVPSFVKSMDMAVTEGEFRSLETNAHNQQRLSYIGTQIAASSVLDPSAQETDAMQNQNDLHAEPASYVTHGIVSGLGAVILRALRAGMPMWGRGGDVRLLGGEFVFECRPADDVSDISLRCTYAHRMQTPRGHASVSRILAAAGVHVPSPSIGNDRSGRLVGRSGKDKDAQRLVRALSNSGRQRTLSRSFGKSLSRNLNSSSTALDAQSRTSSSAIPRSVSSTTASSAIEDAPSHVADVSSGRSATSVGVFARFQAPQGGRVMTGKSAPERSRRLTQTLSSPGGEIVIAVTQERHDRPSATTRRVIRENEENSGFAGKQNATVKSSDLAEFPSLPSHPEAHATAASRQSLTSVVSSSDSSFVFKEVCAKKPMPETTMLSEHCADYVGYWSDDGDDECSVRDELEGQIHFPHSVSTYGPSFWMDDGEIEHGRWPAQSECYSSAPTHGHSTVKHESNGYDGDGSDAEDAWMRARAQSLARLRARKVVRREGGLDGL